MAQNLALISHGEPQWDTKVNAAINRLNEVGVVTDALHLQNANWSNEGLIFQNDFFDHDSGYRYVQFPGFKLVELKIVIGLNKAPDVKSYVQAVTIPDSIDSQVGYDAVSMGTATINISGNKIYVGETNNADWGTGKDSYYTLRKIYIHVD